MIRKRAAMARRSPSFPSPRSGHGRTRTTSGPRKRSGIRIVAWNSLGELVAASLHQRDQILVGGTLVSTSYEREYGKVKKATTVKHTVWQICTDSIRKLNRAHKERRQSLPALTMRPTHDIPQRFFAGPRHSAGSFLMHGLLFHYSAVLLDSNGEPIIFPSLNGFFYASLYAPPFVSLCLAVEQYNLS